MGVSAMDISQKYTLSLILLLWIGGNKPQEGESYGKVTN
jgi:hypothetical protein